MVRKKRDIEYFLLNFACIIMPVKIIIEQQQHYNAKKMKQGMELYFLISLMYFWENKMLNRTSFRE